MAASATLLEQYSDIWIDKHDYLEAERIYYEGKLGSAVVNDLAITMGRKNKSKQSAAPSTVAPPPTPLSPLPNDSPVPASVIPPEPVPKGPQGGKGKSNKGQAAKPVQQQTPKQSSPQLSGDVCPLVDGTQTIAPSSCPSTSPDSGTKNKGAQTSKTEAQMDGIAKLSGDSPALLKKISALETENKSFKKDIQDLTSLVKKLELRLSSLESSSGGGKTPATPTPKATPAPTPASSAAPANDDDVDLFGSDSEEESEEAAKIREERLAAYNAKKSKKPVLIAKSNIILDVKPWGDDTDMKAMETQVRAIAMDGLLWGASKLAPLAYGINKLQISCVVEDDLVSVDALQEAIQDIEEYVQSVDIAAFNKV